MLREANEEKRSTSETFFSLSRVLMRSFLLSFFLDCIWWNLQYYWQHFNCYKDAFTRYSLLFFKSHHSCRICARCIGERCESLQRAYDQVQELLDVCEDDWGLLWVFENFQILHGGCGLPCRGSVFSQDHVNFLGSSDGFGHQQASYPRSCLVWISNQRPTVTLHNINWLVQVHLYSIPKGLCCF
jgi:hypothetical protein